MNTHAILPNGYMLQFLLNVLDSLRLADETCTPEGILPPMSALAVLQFNLSHRGSSYLNLRRQRVTSIPRNGFSPNNFSHLYV